MVALKRRTRPQVREFLNVAWRSFTASPVSRSDCCVLRQVRSASEIPSTRPARWLASGHPERPDLGALAVRQLDFMPISNRRYASAADCGCGIRPHLRNGCHPSVGGCRPAGTAGGIAHEVVRFKAFAIACARGPLAGRSCSQRVVSWWSCSAMAGSRRICHSAWLARVEGSRSGVR